MISPNARIVFCVSVRADARGNVTISDAQGYEIHRFRPFGS